MAIRHGRDSARRMHLVCHPDSLRNQNDECRELAHLASLVFSELKQRYDAHCEAHALTH
jgi:hypothetical protein